MSYENIHINDGNYCTPWLNGDDFCSNGERRADE